MPTPPPSAPEQPDGDDPLSFRIGGPDRVRAVVSVLYDRVLVDPVLIPFFDGVDMARLRAHQHAFLVAALGGPDVFTGRDLGVAHQALEVTHHAFDRLAEHLVTALSDLGVAPQDVVETRAAVEELRPVIVTVPASSIADDPVP